MPTTIIRSLTEQERLDLKSELTSLDHHWTIHTKYPTALRQGRSIHLNQISDNLLFLSTLFDVSPKVFKIVNEIANGKTVARCYWHRLMPNEQITIHTDRNIKFVAKDQLHARYQIYLECPEDLTDRMLMVDNLRCNPKKYQYSIVDFDLRLRHHYHNLSDSPWYFLVFDVLKDGFTLTYNEQK
jgi:hypothetical protein